MADEKNNPEKQKDTKTEANGKNDKKAEKVDKGPEKTEKSEKTEKTEKTAEPQRVGIVVRMLPWIIMGTVVAVCAGGGFGLGRLFAGPKAKTAVKHEQSAKEETKEETKGEAKAEEASPEVKKIWYFDLDPIVANLNEPGVTRYVRAAITLEIDQEMEKEKGIAFFTEKKPLLINWLNIYFASLTIEDIRGDKNQRRIQSQILDKLNEKLFPEAKPFIREVLFKEFAIQ
jgi:flagellar basal body-associated protein FliL